MRAWAALILALALALADPGTGTSLEDGLASLRASLNAHLTSARARRSSACPGGSGNLGFNSFNFVTFVLLVFNAAASVNNNLNANNNNVNTNNLNVVNQVSNNVQTSVNSANQIGITILPIPGRRRKRRKGRKDC